MRRFAIPVAGALLGAAAFGLAGCGNFRDLFSAHADVAADAGGQQLTAERLAQILTSAGKGVRINRDAAEFVANTWVDYELLGRAAAQGKLPTDSAAVATAMWAELSETKGSHWHDTLMARRANVSDSSVDSLYNAGDVRVLQHILFGVRPNTDSAIRDSAHKKAEGTLVKIRQGADFGALASRLSDDPGSKADSGYLPPSPKGRFVVSFDSAGWMLQPGQVSDVVQTAFGYHILKRPLLKDVRPRVQQFLVARASMRLDSIYLDSLASSHRVKVVDGAPAVMRSALEDPEGARNSGKVLVEYSGGTLTVREFLRWVRALPPQYGTQLRQAGDSMLVRFARLLTQNVLLLREADSARITVTPEEWAGMRNQYLGQIDSLKAEIGLDQTDTTSDASVGEREKAAALKVERYFDRLADRKVRLRPMPAALSSQLRDRLPHKLYPAGITRGYELALAQVRADSVKGPLQKAPGGPPLPLGPGQPQPPAPPPSAAPAPGAAIPPGGGAAPGASAPAPRHP